MDNELIAAAIASLTAQDADEINRIDTELHAAFYAALRSGDAPREAFIDHMARITDAREVRPIARDASPALKALISWRQMMRVIQGVRAGMDPAKRARVFLDSRKGAEQMLELIAKAGPSGIRAGELEKALGWPKSNVSRTGSEMEDLGLVMRERVGQAVMYFLGLVGSAVHEGGKEKMTVLPGGLRNAKQYLCAMTG